jgi:7-keto-8-aminopelargonate synthetase-like enzyme
MIDSRKAQHVWINGRKLIIFSSNDYYGLSHHPEVIQAACDAAERYGIGTGGAPGTSGTTTIHVKLAETIARFKHRDKAIIFPSGYAANVGLHQSLGDKETVFFSDEKNHPSAADGIRLSGSVKVIYRHRDYDHLKQLLKEDNHKRKIVTTCSVFTIDGAICRLDILAELKRKYGFILVIDEAHATGCLGRTGRGLEEMFNLEGTADFIMGTFSKAFGSQGGFVTYTADKEKLLRLPAFRPFDYSTSIATPVAAASLKAVEILRDKVSIIDNLKANIRRIYDNFKNAGLELNEPGHHIVNVYLGNEEKTNSVVEELKQSGYFVVPISIDGRHGLRITAMSVHTTEEIDSFCKKLTEIETKYR